jgi:AAA15 family ATPase/GTPase
MLKSLTIKNFTVFTNSKIEFSPGINVIIGDNSTGKSHLLKLAYSMISTLYLFGRDRIQTIEQLEIKFGDKLNGIFKPNILSNLTHKPEHETEISIENDLENLSFSLQNNEIKADHLPSSYPQIAPLYFPTQEVLSLQPSVFIALYENRYLPIDETYYDLCKALNLPLLKKYSAEIQQIIKPLEAELGGKVVLDNNGRFYLDIPQQGKIEISLIAEGLKKIATLVYLIMNGSLLNGSTLFWDETEANLNPRMRVKVAKALAALAKQGVQIILTTHDLFLMKELSLLIDINQIPARFFSLKRQNQDTNIEQGKVLEDLQTIVSLEEELALYDREQSAYYAKKAL